MQEDDLEAVLAWRNHPEVRRYMYTRHEIGLEEHCRWFAHAVAQPGKHLLIFEADGRPCGFANLTQHGTDPIADWGFYLAPDAPRGAGQRLGRAVLAYAFDTLVLHKLCGEVLAHNERSLRFHRRLGFEEEGRLRDQHYDGEHFYAVVCFGLLRHEWQPTAGEP
ncbi:GCN5 family acetyltransferase [Halomonas salina]|uniref:GCN5 family acetyltransferase n=2 Tax=Halomonas salina TaxID=42565 RepID=A0ABR4WWM1_9GAMM|nr:GCN5 family acetyltransferase [Halomonas salina]